MANNPTGQSSSNYSGFLSNAGFSIVEERSGNLESVPLFGFEAKEIDNNSSQQSIAEAKHQQQQQQHHQHVAAMSAMPLNVVTPPWTSSGAYASTDGIISVASKESMGFLPSSKDGMGQHVHSSHGSPPGSSNDTMIGLELGKRTYFEVPGSSSGVNSNNNSATATTTTTTSSQSPSPSPAATATTPSAAPGGSGGTNSHAQPQSASQILPKRPRVAGQIPKCQVEGCKTDLSSAKDYHRRHKVCAIHSKAARVIVAGQEQRFCQQCSRFHGLSEFDEGKRSCRRRLAGHNERRRKPQPDPLGLNARFLPAAFQDNRRLGALYTDRSSFLTHPRISGVSALWDECNMNPNAHKGAWAPRILKYEDVSSFDHGALSGGSERQLFLAGMQHSNDNTNSSRSSIFPPQSPKGMIPVSNDVSGLKTHQYFQGSVDPLGQSLSLTSSGAGVLSGLEAIPIGQGLIKRVSDSGRALSLQSTSPASVVVSSLETTGHTHTHSLSHPHSHSNLMSDQNLHNNHHIPMAQPLGTVAQQHQFEWMNDKQMLNAAAAASNLHAMSSGSVAYHSGSSNNMEKEHHLERSYTTPGLNGVGNYECHPLYSMIHGDMPQDAKPTIDLMQMASAPHNQGGQPYEMSIGTFGDLQALRSYESTIFSSQQM